MITLVMPALLWLVAPVVVALTTYDVISGGVLASWRLSVFSGLVTLQYAVVIS